MLLARGETLYGLRFTDVDFSALELDLAGLEGEEGVVLADADVEAGVEAGAALADDDRAGADGLAAVGLDAEVLGVGVAAVPGGAAAFLMCHGSPLVRNVCGKAGVGTNKEPRGIRAGRGG